MAVAEYQVDVAVVVVIEKLQPQPLISGSNSSNAESAGDIRKGFVLLVVVQRIGLVIHVGHKQIDPAVLIIVRRIHSHAGAGLAERVVSHSGQQTDSPRTVLSRDSRNRKFGMVSLPDKKVHPAVVVDICRHNAPGLRGQCSDAGFLSHIGKRAVAVVVEQPARKWRQYTLGLQ